MMVFLQHIAYLYFVYVLYGKQKKKFEHTRKLWFHRTIQPKGPFFCQHILQENRQCNSPW
jgi:hypothetical protein